MISKEHLSSLVYITGCDGTGKSTQVKLLIDRFRIEGKKVSHLWLRFPFFFSIPFLVFARWKGYSWYEKIGNTEHGYWNFQTSWVMKNVFPWFFLIDTLLAATWKLYLPLLLRRMVICERFAIDILVDLTVAIEDLSFATRLPGKIFIQLIPRGAFIVALDLDEDLVRQRRVDLQTDKKLHQRLNTFRAICSLYHITALSSHGNIEAVNDAICEMLKNAK
jgi:hypothetical protein